MVNLFDGASCAVNHLDEHSNVVVCPDENKYCAFSDRLEIANMITTEAERDNLWVQYLKPGENDRSCDTTVAGVLMKPEYPSSLRLKDAVGQEHIIDPTTISKWWVDRPIDKVHRVFIEMLSYPKVEFSYSVHRDEHYTEHTVRPMNLWFGGAESHDLEPRWFLAAIEHEGAARTSRDYALSGIDKNTLNACTHPIEVPEQPQTASPAPSRYAKRRAREKALEAALKTSSWSPIPTAAQDIVEKARVFEQYLLEG